MFHSACHWRGASELQAGLPEGNVLGGESGADGDREIAADLGPVARVRRPGSQLEIERAAGKISQQDPGSRILENEGLRRGYGLEQLDDPRRVGSGSDNE